MSNRSSIRGTNAFGIPLHPTVVANWDRTFTDVFSDTTLIEEDAFLSDEVALPTMQQMESYAQTDEAIALHGTEDLQRFFEESLWLEMIISPEYIVPYEKNNTVKRVLSPRETISLYTREFPTRYEIERSAISSQHTDAFGMHLVYLRPRSTATQTTLTMFDLSAQWRKMRHYAMSFDIDITVGEAAYFHPEDFSIEHLSYMAESPSELFSAVSSYRSYFDEGDALIWAMSMLAHTSSRKDSSSRGKEGSVYEAVALSQRLTARDLYYFTKNKLAFDDIHHLANQGLHWNSVRPFVENDIRSSQSIIQFINNGIDASLAGEIS